MVTPKRGRGARNQAAKGKAAAPAEEVQAAAPEAEPVAETEPSADDNNGDIEPMEQGDEAAAADAAGDAADGEQNQSNAEAEGETEEKKEEKVESGKLLVENLPPSYLFDYQDKLKELFSKHGEITNVKRGPIIVTELTTTPTLSAIVEFKNKESLDKALTEEGTVVDGCAISVAIESRPETAVLVGVPYEASTDYVRLLFAQCGHVAHIHEFSKTKYKILRVTFHEREGVEKALKLDRELRINGFLVTVSKYRDDDEQKAHNASANKKRQHGSGQRNNNQASAAPAAPAAANNSPNGRNNNYRPRGAPYTARPTNYRGNRGRGGFGGGRGGSFPRGGFAPLNTYMPPQPFMGRPGGFMDGQRPNKRLRQM